ncbi:MAG: cysteine dioxygenase family protein [Planctomycetes bacterium]|nr:cysteine dioxygenase family protein [Planctomycetota bacterium]MCB9911983.1 cysteine dioxygenase family protein [Planctomycetota bacterium]HPF12936.1 cysteine dioxygenase family protein [Planctomycetota bacterium]
MQAAPLSLSSLIDHLEGLDSRSISQDLVSELLAQTSISKAQLRPLLNFRPEKYTRNLIHRAEQFELMILCWPAGKTSPIHDHCDQLGWVRVLSGALEETGYTLAEGSSLEHEEAPCCVEPCFQGVQAAGTIVSAVDRYRGIHKLGALEEDSVSLHIYSKPHDRCRVFDRETQHLSWRPLAFDSKPNWRGSEQVGLGRA